MRILFAFAAAAIVLGAAADASAFCVYNKIHRYKLDENVPKLYEISAWIVRGGRYKSADLAPGKNGCCHWSNKGCNFAGQRNSIVRMKIAIVDSYSSYTIAKWPQVEPKINWKTHTANWADLCEVDVQAGGWIEIVREFTYARPGDRRSKRRIVYTCKAFAP